MRRSAFLIVSAASSLVMLGVIGWLKWSEAASPARLKADIQQEVFKELRLHATTLHPGDIQVQIESIEEIPHGYREVKGTMTIPRRPFSIIDPGTGKVISFTPSGEVRAEFEAFPTLAHEHVAAAPWLGPRHPVWRGVSVYLMFDEKEMSIHGQKFLVPAWHKADREPNEAAFDAHLAFVSEFRQHSVIRDNAVLFVACKSLRALDRPAEAATLAKTIGSRSQLEVVFDTDIGEAIAHFMLQATGP